MLTTERCPAIKDGLQCVLAVGHTEPHQLPADPGWAPAAASATVATQAPAAAPIAGGRPMEWGGVVILIAGCLAILGSFLPWIQATAALVGTVTRSGLEGGDGLITIALGIVIALLGIAIAARSGSGRTARIGALVCAIVLGIVALIDISDVNKRLAGLNSTVVLGSLGVGLIVVAFAAVLTVIGALLPRPHTVETGMTGAETQKPAAGGPSMAAIGVGVVAVVVVLLIAYQMLQNNVNSILENVARSV